MTVAAVILASAPGSPLAETLGQPRARRLVDLAWAGGALPVVVVAPDGDGSVARAIAETEAVHVAPVDPLDGIGALLDGGRAAGDHVRDVTAVLAWPDRMVWVGAETVTSLIEAHGVQPDDVLRPTWHGELGWPVLIPTPLLGGIRPGGSLEAAVDGLGPATEIDLGDPGAIFDSATPESDLPPYEGPSAPAGGHVHEWGDDIADGGDAPGEGRGLAPYPQAAPGGPADT
jgi:hypothetical protein